MWLRDALTGQKVQIERPGQTLMIYCCGPTVYDHMHIGNSRSLIIVDLILRTLRYQGQKLTYLHNITDIDDKIIAAAQRQHLTEKQYSQPFVQQYHAHWRQLNLLPTDHTVLVSDYIQQQIKFIQTLLTRKVAYQIDREVLFDVRPYINHPSLYYYQLSHFNPDVTKHRIAQTTTKRSLLDFVLWKETTSGITFNAPWGRGRPGWHTECAALVNYFFQGQTIDLHVGGVDLKFPHHENERIQYIAKNQRELARVWFYVGQLKIRKQKMSKSLGNVIYIRDFLQRYSENILRYIFYASHYQNPLHITDQVLHEAQLFEQKLAHCYQTVLCHPRPVSVPVINQQQFVPAVLMALNHNLNSRQVVTVMYKLMKIIIQQAQTGQLTSDLIAEFYLICEDLCGFAAPSVRR